MFVVNRPNSADLQLAGRLLAYEQAAGSGDVDATTAAVRVYEKLIAHLAPLVGALGVNALLARSVKLTQGELASSAEVSVLEGSPNLREWLKVQDPAVVAEASAAVFGTFFALLTAFIGERLTTQLLRSAWPKLEEPASSETKK